MQFIAEIFCALSSLVDLRRCVTFIKDGLQSFTSWVREKCIVPESWFLPLNYTGKQCRCCENDELKKQIGENSYWRILRMTRPRHDVVLQVLQAMRLSKVLRNHSAVMPARPGGRRHGGAASSVIFSNTNFPRFVFLIRRFHSIYIAFQYN